VADSNKLLKELSNLSSNFDSLYQELKASTQANTDSSNEVKNLIAEVKKGNSLGDGDLKGVFEGFTKSLSKTIADQNDQILNGLTDKISQSFSGSVSNFLGNVPQQIAQVKAGNMPDFKSILGGNSIKGIVSNAASRIPGLADGGTVESSGIAVVGEKGPELVELKSGDKVRTKEEQLMEMLLEEERAKNEKLGRVRRTGPTEEEVEAYRQELLAEDPEFYSDPAELQEELDYFKSEQGYELETRETFSPADLKKLIEPVTTKETSVVKSAQEIKEAKEVKETRALKEVKEVKETPALKEEDKKGKSVKFEDFLSGVTSKAKEKLDEAKARGKANLQSSVAELKEKNPINQVKSDAEKIKSQIQENIASIKGMSGNSTSKPVEQKATAVKEPKKTRGSVSSSNASGDSSMSSSDIKEMKGLLASIYQALRSPLTIANDVPFRPNSNNF